jgi:hypothetical protein
MRSRVQSSVSLPETERLMIKSKPLFFCPCTQFAHKIAYLFRLPAILLSCLLGAFALPIDGFQRLSVLFGLAWGKLPSWLLPSTEFFQARFPRPLPSASIGHLHTDLHTNAAKVNTPHLTHKCRGCLQRGYFGADC